MKLLSRFCLCAALFSATGLIRGANLPSPCLEKKPTDRAFQAGAFSIFQTYAQGASAEAGDGVPQDYQKAVSIYRSACADGATGNGAVACIALARLLDAGKGVEKNAKQADKIFRVSCYNPDSPTITTARCYAGRWRDECRGGRGQSCFLAASVFLPQNGSMLALLPPLTQAAADWYERGCALNDPQSCYSLTELRGGADPGVLDAARNVGLLEKSCHKHHIASCLRLAEISRHSFTTKLLSGDQRKWLRTACRHDLHQACMHQFYLDDCAAGQGSSCIWAARAYSPRLALIAPSGKRDDRAPDKRKKVGNDPVPEFRIVYSDVEFPRDNWYQTYAVMFSDEAQTGRLLDRACSLKNQLGCRYFGWWLAGEAKPDLSALKVAAASLKNDCQGKITGACYPADRIACDAGGSEACLEAARAVEALYWDADLTFPLLERGCRAGQYESCWMLASGLHYGTPASFQLTAGCRKSAQELGNTDAKKRCHAGDADACRRAVWRFDEYPAAWADAVGTPDYQRACDGANPTPGDFAAPLYARACRKGDGAACRKRGGTVERECDARVPGDPREEDPVPEIIWYRRGCILGDREACSWFVERLHGDEKYWRDNLLACEHDIAEACFHATRRPPGAPQLAAQADYFAFVNKSCRLGYAEACDSIARDGWTGVSEAERIPVFRQACDAGDDRSCARLLLAKRCSSGDALACAQSAVWRDKPELADTACDQGEPLGCWLEGIRRFHSGKIEERRSSRPLLKKACDGGVPMACGALLPPIYSGLGIPPKRKT